jgi:ABC-2 type transport system ATP-binding protein
LQNRLSDILPLIQSDPAQATESLHKLVRSAVLPAKLSQELILFVSNYNALVLTNTGRKNYESDMAAYLAGFETRLREIITETGEQTISVKDEAVLEKINREFGKLKPRDNTVVRLKDIRFSYSKRKIRPKQDSRPTDLSEKPTDLPEKQPPFELSCPELILKYGEITGVIGENGQGKSTLLRLIAGNLTPNSGNIHYRFLGKNPSASINYNLLKQQIAYIPQRLPQWEGKVQNNLHFMAAIKGIRGDQNRHEVDFILNRLNLEKYGDYQWSELSGGYQMRFELANMLVWKPKLLILDEPLANLDIIAQSLFLKDLRDFARNAGNPFSVIISSQHLHMLDNVADNITFLKNGKQTFNDRRESIGVGRKENLFELECNCSTTELRMRLGELKILRINNIGFTTVLYTSTDVTLTQIMAKLAGQEGLTINLLRDISHSSKALLYKSYEY